MSNLEKAWRYPLGLIMGLPYVPVLLICAWLDVLFWIAYAVTHPVNPGRDGINTTIAEWVERNPDHAVFRASAWYEKQIQKVLKM